VRLAYGNYGMPRTQWSEMVRVIAGIGYHGLELCVGAAYPTAPERLSADDRAALRRLCAEQQLALTSLLVVGMTVVEPDDARHAANLERLRTIVALGHELGLDRPIVTNTLGGESADWPAGRDLLLARVGDWARVAQAEGGVFATEPHVGGIVDSPERARWLLGALGGAAGVNFDYSHFQLIPISLADALDALVPYALGVHVKDVVGSYPAVRFLLPGEGQLDYATYLRALAAHGYDGWVTIEISGQIFNAPGYDGEYAARFSYKTLADALATTGLRTT